MGNKMMQEIVAASLSKAVVKVNRKARKLGLQGRAFIPLYDAIYSLCPLEERFIFEKLHQECLCEEVTWKIDDRVLKFAIDTSFTIRWATKPTDEEKKLLNDKTYRNLLNEQKE